MPKRIVPEHSTERDLYRHLNQVFNQRAADLLRDGRNPEQAAMLAAEYSQRAQALDPQATKR